MSVLVRDDFLTGIVGRPAFRVALTPQGCDKAIVEAMLEAQRQPSFFYAKLPTSSVASVHRLEELGFHVVDTNVTFERSVAGQATPGSARHARPDDREAVMALATNSFAHSRLHLDPAIPRHVADRSRAEWAGNFFAGKRGDHMMISEVDGGLAGFALLLGPKNGVLTIDLIGVAAPFRRRGIAGTLIAAAGAIAGAQTLRVGTQIANMPSLRLYETLGFRITGTQYVLHYHRV